MSALSSSCPDARGESPLAILFFDTHQLAVTFLPQVQPVKEEEFDNLGLTEDDAKVYIHRLVYAPAPDESQ